jgi:hypothetical protein
MPLLLPGGGQWQISGGAMRVAKVSFLFAAACLLAACGGTSDRALAEDVCALDQRCFPDEFSSEFSSLEQCVELTIQDFEDIDRIASSNCARAARSLAACIADLSCSEYQDYFEEPTPDYPCHQQDRDLFDNCTF